MSLVSIIYISLLYQTNKSTNAGGHKRTTTMKNFKTQNDEVSLSKEDLISGIGIKKTGYGHWRLSADFKVYGETLHLSTITTDSQLIDAWQEEPGYLGYDDVEATAVTYIERANYAEIVEHCQAVELKNLKKHSAELVSALK